MIEYYKLRERKEKHFDDTTEIVGLDGKVFSVSPYPYSDSNREQVCQTVNEAFTAGFNFALATTKQMEVDIRNKAFEEAEVNGEKIGRIAVFNQGKPDANNMTEYHYAGGCKLLNDEVQSFSGRTWHVREESAWELVRKILNTVTRNDDLVGGEE